MSRYAVTMVYSAIESLVVEADSAEAAVRKASEDSRASLCCCCSEHLELGDVYEVIAEKLPKATE